MIDVIEPTKDITILIAENPALAILNAEKFEAFYEKIKAETETLVVDVTTNKGRDEIRSMAFKVAKTRAAIDKARLGLTEEWRTKTKKANDAGAQIKARLEALEEKVRAPLTEWEEAEKLRAQKHERILKLLSDAAIIQFDDNAKIVASRINEINSCEIDPSVHGVATDVVLEQKTKTLTILNSALERMKIEEAERAELERLRKEASERAAAEAARIEAEERVAREEAAKIAEQERIEKERQAAVEAAIAAERERADRIEREAAEEAARKAEQEQKEEAARLAREQDREHRAKVLGAAKSAIMQYGVDEAKARDIVLAIAAGNIPAVSIAF